MEMRLEVVVVPVADAAGQPDPEWADWYARYMADEQDGQAARS